MTAYVVVEVEIHDAQAFDAYRKSGLPTIAQHGGRVLARSDAAVPLEGGWRPPRIVIIEFPSVAAAQGWHASDEYQAAMKLRIKAGITRSVAFEALIG